MKKAIRAMILTASALAFVAAPSASTEVFAQNAAAAPAECTSPDKEKLYTQDFKNNFKGNAQQQKIALESARQYVQRFSQCEEDKPIVEYLQKWIGIKVKADEEEAVIKPCNDAVTAKNDVGIVTGCKNYLAKNPDDVNVRLIVVDSGYNLAKAKNDTYNGDTIDNARLAIEKINAGKATDKYGYFKDKEEALAWMNYTIGYITDVRQQKKSEAAPFFYKAASFNSGLKKSYFPYLFIGEMYLAEYTKAADDYTAKFGATPNTDEAKQAAGMWKAYADRAAEYFARAYNIAKADPKVKPETVQGINETLTQLYKLRHNNTTTGMEAFVSGFNTKPVTDPASTVTPVIETTTTTATTSISSNSASSGDSAAGGRTTGASAANGTAAGSATKTATKATATKTTATKKPAPRKKS